MINPVTHADSPEKIAVYQGEPYVTCGDVYAAPGLRGRAGWSWYTGSCGWLYRAGLEYLLGFKKRGDSIEIDPCIPRGWREFSVTYRHRGKVYHIAVNNPSGATRGVKEVIIDGAAVPEKVVNLAALKEMTEHSITVVMG